MLITETIKQARIGRYTQQEMALCLGMSQPNYANIENGRSEPTTEVLFRIARILGIDLNRFIVNIDVMPCHKIISDHRQAKALRSQRRVHDPA